MSDLKKHITEYGQEYIDEPVYVTPKAGSVIQDSVSKIFGNEEKERKPILVAYDRVRLRWMKPDANGSLTQKLPGRR